MWDLTGADTMALSYLPLTSASVGAAAEGAALRKISKYVDCLSPACLYH